MAELTPAQRAAAIKRRKEIWEVLHPEKVVDVTVKAKPSSGTTCPTTPKISARGRVGEGRPEAFAADTSKISGESKQDINRHIARAEALGPDIYAVVGTSLRAELVRTDGTRYAQTVRSPSRARDSVNTH